jgi:hypothetical protein
VRRPELTLMFGAQPSSVASKCQSESAGVGIGAGAGGVGRSAAMVGAADNMPTPTRTAFDKPLICVPGVARHRVSAPITRRRLLDKTIGSDNSRAVCGDEIEATHVENAAP